METLGLERLGSLETGGRSIFCILHDCILCSEPLVWAKNTTVEILRFNGDLAGSFRVCADSDYVLTAKASGNTAYFLVVSNETYNIVSATITVDDNVFPPALVPSSVVPIAENVESIVGAGNGAVYWTADDYCTDRPERPRHKSFRVPVPSHVY